MGFLFGLHAAAGADQPTAIHREDVFPVAGVHDATRAAGDHQLQHRSFVLGGLERRQRGHEQSTRVHFSEQQRIQSRP